ncbi:MAG: hypothetical protein ACJ8EY_10395 [Sphingomicrobium sp.]
MFSRDSLPSAADSAPGAEHARTYNLCFFLPGYVVPWVQLIDADTDEHALEVAESLNPSTARELWHRHRLVAVISPLAEQTH